MIEVESIKSLEKLIFYVSNNKVNDIVVIIICVVKSFLIVLFDFSFDFMMLVFNFGSNLWDIVK